MFGILTLEICVISQPGSLFSRLFLMGILYATIEYMARGWESKSVEEQIQLAGERAASLKTQNKVDEAQAAKQRELDSLHLSRTRVVQDMAAATNPRYREQLQRSLDFLDEKLTQAAKA